MDTAKNDGSHWVALYARNKSDVVYFDSYGLEPNEYIKEYLGNFRKITRNVRIFQSLISNVCGHYCVYFLYFMSLGLDFEKIIRTLHCAENSDVLVRKFVSNFFSKINI